MTRMLIQPDVTEGFDRIRRGRRPTGAPVAGAAGSPLFLRRSANATLPNVADPRQVASAVTPTITAPYGYGVNERPGNAVPPLANDIGSVAQVQDARQANYAA